MANVIIISVLIVLVCVGARRVWRTIRYGGGHAVLPEVHRIRRSGLRIGINQTILFHTN